MDFQIFKWIFDGFSMVFPWILNGVVVVFAETHLILLFLGSAKCGVQERQPTTAVVFGETHLITPFVLGFREMRSPGTSTYYCCCFR